VIAALTHGNGGCDPDGCDPEVGYLLGIVHLLLNQLADAESALNGEN
jgi:hypothetical protein